MTTIDLDFAADLDVLEAALALLRKPTRSKQFDLPAELPLDGFGSLSTLEGLAPLVLGGAASLGAPGSMAHMDPPTPTVAWAATLWNAALNQNLLHPQTAPMARDVERLVIDWISTPFGMTGGHLTSGSTTANLTSLWVARERHGVRRVIASEQSHLSVAKSANLLGLELCLVPVGDGGRLCGTGLPADLSDAALVLTAGTTGAGAVDPLDLCGRAAWTHVDAAWAGPLRFSERHAHLLNGIERADAVAVSGHKLMFQPKECGIVLFREAEESHAAISFGGAYLAAPNVGLQGSHGAAGVVLLATLLSWGRRGLAERVERCMAEADRLTEWLQEDPRVELLREPTTGVVVWRPTRGLSSAQLATALTPGLCSQYEVDGELWLRNVFANPNANSGALIEELERILARQV